MSDPCEYCLNNQPDEYGSWYCAEGGALDEDEMFNEENYCGPYTPCSTPWMAMTRQR